MDYVVLVSTTLHTVMTDINVGKVCSNGVAILIDTFVKDLYKNFITYLINARLEFPSNKCLVLY